MNRDLTPIDWTRPRILMHARGKMDAAECRFWASLRHALRHQGGELFVIGHNPPAQHVDVPVLRVPNGCDRVDTRVYTHGWDAWYPQALPDPLDFLLEREQLWWGPGDPKKRTDALVFFQRFYGQAVEAVDPSLICIWNGTHAQELVLAHHGRDLCRPLTYIERSPFPGFLHMDTQGILGGSSLARHSSGPWLHPRGPEPGRSYAAARHILQDPEATWWPQPRRRKGTKYRKKIGIRESDRVVLFAGQVDADAQNFFFAPLFDTNLDAFRWLSGQLQNIDDLFLLGKHHPMNWKSPGPFQAAIQGRGVWSADIPLHEALQLADYVAAVNSSVLYEGLVLEKPVLQLGQSLLSNKNIAYEVRDRSEGDRVVQDWLARKEWPERLGRWGRYADWLFGHVFYAMTPPQNRTEGLRNEKHLAGDLMRLVGESPPGFRTTPPPRQPFLEEASAIRSASHGENGACAE